MEPSTDVSFLAIIRPIGRIREKSSSVFSCIKPLAAPVCRGIDWLLALLPWETTRAHYSVGVVTSASTGFTVAFKVTIMEVGSSAFHVEGEDKWWSGFLLHFTVNNNAELVKMKHWWQIKKDLSFLKKKKKKLGYRHKEWHHLEIFSSIIQWGVDVSMQHTGEYLHDDHQKDTKHETKSGNSWKQLWKPFMQPATVRDHHSWKNSSVFRSFFVSFSYKDGESVTCPKACCLIPGPLDHLWGERPWILVTTGLCFIAFKQDSFDLGN